MVHMTHQWTSNGVAQSTLMRAIANEQLDGFPPKSELRTVFVEHDIDASASETAVVDYVFMDPVLQGAYLTSPIVYARHLWCKCFIQWVIDLLLINLCRGHARCSEGRSGNSACRS
jgi:hypothetical protein